MRSWFSFTRLYRLSGSVVRTILVNPNYFLKTLLALIVVAMLIAAYSAGLAFLLFGQSNYRGGPSDEFKDMAEYIFSRVIPVLFWWVLAPFLLLVSYFKLKERQV